MSVLFPQLKAMGSIGLDRLWWGGLGRVPEGPEGSMIVGVRPGLFFFGRREKVHTFHLPIKFVPAVVKAARFIQGISHKRDMDEDCYVCPARSHAQETIRNPSVGIV